MSNTTPVKWDAESQAYIDRYPYLAPVLALYGSEGARLHYQNHGKGEGKTWGLTTPTPAAPAGPVETVSTQPLPASYGTDANSWDAYLKSARTATEGMNQMPGVFSDYSNIPTDDAAAKAMFYPTAANGGVGQNAAATSALAALLGQGSGMATGGPAMAGQSTFDRIINAGPEAFSNGLITEYGRRGGMTPDEMSFYMKGRDYYGG